MTMMGMLGEYLWRALDEARGARASSRDRPSRPKMAWTSQLRMG
jgi:hypothetical protein